MKRVFISFDFDHDEELRDALVGQARNPDSPFEIADWSVHEPFDDNWRQRVRVRTGHSRHAIGKGGGYPRTLLRCPCKVRSYGFIA